MPLPFQQPEFSAGMSLTSKQFQQNLQNLAGIASQQSLQPGQFQGGGYNVQRRVGGGGSSTSTSPTTYIELIETVPGKTRKQNCAYLYTFDSDPMVLDWAPVLVNPDAAPEDPDYLEIQKIGIINFGYRTLRGSEDIPHPMSGVDVITINEAAEDDESPEPELADYNYLIVTPDDHASYIGTELTTIDGLPQGPSKPDGSRHFTNDGGPCETEAP